MHSSQCAFKCNRRSSDCALTIGVRRCTLFTNVSVRVHAAFILPRLFNNDKSFPWDVEAPDAPFGLWPVGISQFDKRYIRNWLVQANSSPFRAPLSFRGTGPSAIGHSTNAGGPITRPAMRPLVDQRTSSVPLVQMSPPQPWTSPAAGDASSDPWGRRCRLLRTKSGSKDQKFIREIVDSMSGDGFPLTVSRSHALGDRATSLESAVATNVLPYLGSPFARSTCRD